MVLAVPEETIRKIGDILSDEGAPLKKRFRALFTLRSIGGSLAIDLIARNFVDSSALLKHELAYCLGQMRDSYAVPILRAVLSDEAQEVIVRHEAGEAIGAIGDSNHLDILQKYRHSPIQPIAETCELASRRIQWWTTADSNERLLVTNVYDSIDPAPHFPAGFGEELSSLKKLLMDEDEQLWNRYRALFTLRNVATNDAVACISKALGCPRSALFRHEVAFVLGQIGSELAVAQLAETLRNTEENEMVRHECAEALGAIATNDCKQALEPYLHDPVRVVRESCEIALDVCDYATSSEFQYADLLCAV